MSAAPSDLDLRVLPPEYRVAFEAQQAQIAALSSDNSALAVSNRRLEAPIEELRHALRGRKSEKLTADERQLAFEELTIAIEEVEAASAAAHATPPASRPRRAPVNRNIGNLPEHLPRIEEVIEPESLECPCGCGTMHRIGEDRTERLVV
jgi:transposase